MTKLKSNEQVIGEVNCEKCNRLCPLKEITYPRAKQLKSAFYWSQYYYCSGCGYFGRDDAFKVWNTNERALEVKRYLASKEEMDRQNNFLGNIQ